VAAPRPSRASRRGERRRDLHWQQTQRLAEIEEIDAELLTDDLPIDAYLDRGFEAWLKKRAAR
jgi:hypothetical protein